MLRSTWMCESGLRQGDRPRCYSLTGGRLLRLAGPGLPGPAPCLPAKANFSTKFDGNALTI